MKALLSCIVLLCISGLAIGQSSNDDVARKALLATLDPFSSKSPSIIEIHQDATGKIISCTKDGVPCNPADCMINGNCPTGNCSTGKKAGCECGCTCPADCTCDRGTCQCANCLSSTHRQKTVSLGVTYVWNGSQWAPMNPNSTGVNTSFNTSFNTTVRPQRALLPWNAGPVYNQQGMTALPCKS